MPSDRRLLSLLDLCDAGARRYWAIKTATWYRWNLGSVGAGCVIRRPLLLRRTRGIHLGRDVHIRQGARLELVPRPGHEAPRLVLGDRVNIEQGVHIACCGEIVLEADVTLAARCAIVDTTHPHKDPTLTGSRVGHVATGPAFVRIGERAFLGTGVVVLPNVTIGAGAVIGANAVVTRDVPSNSVAVGAPARVIATFGDSDVMPPHSGAQERSTAQGIPQT